MLISYVILVTISFLPMLVVKRIMPSSLFRKHQFKSEWILWRPEEKLATGIEWFHTDHWGWMYRFVFTCHDHDRYFCLSKSLLFTRRFYHPAKCLCHYMLIYSYRTTILIRSPTLVSICLPTSQSVLRSWHSFDSSYYILYFRRWSIASWPELDGPSRQFWHGWY